VAIDNRRARVVNVLMNCIELLLASVERKYCVGCIAWGIVAVMSMLRYGKENCMRVCIDYGSERREEEETRDIYCSEQ
jgi:hypothetical protein